MRRKPGGKHRNEPHDVFKQIDMSAGDEACWPWKGALRTGNRGEQRPIFSIAGVKHYAYRIVWECINGRKLEPNEVIQHQCDNPKCCNPKHLVAGVQKDNVADMVKRERIGQRHVIIKKIMYLLESDCTSVYIQQYMKEKYDEDIDDSTIRKIRNRTRYQHIEWAWGDARAAERAKRIEEERS